MKGHIGIKLAPVQAEHYTSFLKQSIENGICGMIFVQYSNAYICM